MSGADTVVDRLDRLARISAYPWKLTRRVFTPQHAEADALVLGWMEEAGLSVRRDPAGNLIGRLDGPIPGGPAIVIGGSVTTGEDAGPYGGTLGVVMGIAAVARVLREGPPLRHAVEVVAFAEDAANRFGPRLLGSKAVVGRFDPALLDLADDYDVTLRQALDAYGLDADKVETARRRPDEILAYLEVAAEAGPVLEQSASPVGIVPTMSEASMLRITLTGAVGSATTIPMADRRDALAGTAECILAAERIGACREGIMVTVVRIAVDPVPAFVVTGSVTFGVLIGSSDDAARRAVVPDLTAAFEGIAARRRLEITVEEGIDPDATRCDPGIVALFERAVAATGLPVARLAQGLSTNAFNMAVLGPIGLMLVRCRGAVGWGPAGVVDPADLAAGLDVLTFVVGSLAGGTDVPSPGGP